MKYYLVLIFTLLSCLSYAQIDVKKPSISIPAVIKKVPDNKVDGSRLLKKKTDNSKAFGSLYTFKKKEKEFSMFPEEKFGNVRELYEKRVQENIAELKPSEREIALLNGSSEDQYFGDFKTQSTFVNIVYRDHGYADGDLIQVRVNDDIIVPRVLLGPSFKGLHLDLQPGFNKIDFVALNQGSSGPNTAEFKVFDDAKNVISQNRWNLATGVKATVILVKE